MARMLPRHSPIIFKIYKYNPTEDQGKNESNYYGFAI